MTDERWRIRGFRLRVDARGAGAPVPSVRDLLNSSCLVPVFVSVYESEVHPTGQGRGAFRVVVSTCLIIETILQNRVDSEPHH